MVVAAQHLSRRYPLLSLRDAIQSLDSVLAQLPPSDAPTPNAPSLTSDPDCHPPSSLVVSACYKCGSVGVFSRSSNSAPSCYWCQGLWFLGLAAAEATSSSQPRPLPALPGFLGHLTGFPPPVVAGVATRLRLWLADVQGLVEEKGPGVLVSPPWALETRGSISLSC